MRNASKFALFLLDLHIQNFILLYYLVAWKFQHNSTSVTIYFSTNKVHFDDDWVLIDPLDKNKRILVQKGKISPTPAARKKVF